MNLQGIYLEIALQRCRSTTGAFYAFLRSRNSFLFYFLHNTIYIITFFVSARTVVCLMGVQRAQRTESYPARVANEYLNCCEQIRHRYYNIYDVVNDTIYDNIIITTVIIMIMNNTRRYPSTYTFILKHLMTF